MTKATKHFRFSFRRIGSDVHTFQYSPFFPEEADSEEKVKAHITKWRNDFSMAQEFSDVVRSIALWHSVGSGNYTVTDGIDAARLKLSADSDLNPVMEQVEEYIIKKWKQYSEYGNHTTKDARDTMEAFALALSYHVYCMTHSIRAQNMAISKKEWNQFVDEYMVPMLDTGIVEDECWVPDDDYFSDSCKSSSAYVQPKEWTFEDGIQRDTFKEAIEKHKMELIRRAQERMARAAGFKPGGFVSDAPNGPYGVVHPAQMFVGQETHDGVVIMKKNGIIYSYHFQGKTDQSLEDLTEEQERDGYEILATFYA